MDEYDQALPLWKRALAINEKVLGPEHPDTARSFNNLGALYQAMGEDVQALLLYARASNLRENPRPRASKYGDEL
jgi:tetratricopeptide (TPR) repeat protein